MLPLPARASVLNHDCATTATPSFRWLRMFSWWGDYCPIHASCRSTTGQKRNIRIRTTRTRACCRSGGKLRSEPTAELCSLSLLFNGITLKLMQKDVQNGLRASPSLHAARVAVAGTDGVGVCWCQVRARLCQGRHEESRCSKRGVTRPCSPHQIVNTN